MKTIELRDSFGIDSLVLGDRPMPTPGAGEILLKVNAASLVVDGTFFPNLQFPFVPTSDAAGRIEQVGSGVTKFKPWRSSDYPFHSGLGARSLQLYAG
jgi:NADPH:quinone reductase-like Zn-dependent oxidoreductase